MIVLAEVLVRQVVIPVRIVDGRNPAPLGNHGKPLLVGIYRESSFRGFLGGAGFRPSTVALSMLGVIASPGPC